MSRCQRFDFHRISQNDIADKLKEICDGEGIKIEQEALNVLAKNATGSLRDAENLLEKLSTHYGSDINLNQVRDMLGITGNERIKELVGHIINANITDGIKTINEINNDGFDLKQLNRELISYLRGLLLIKTGYSSDIEFTPEETVLLKELADKSTVEKILKAIKIFGKLELSLDSYSTLPLELAMVDCSLVVPEERPVSAAVSKTATPDIKPEQVTYPAPSTPPAPKRNVKQEPAIVSEPDMPSKLKTELQTDKIDDLKEEQAINASTGKKKSEHDNKLEYLCVNWKDVIEHAPDNVKRSPALAILRSAGVKPVAFDNNTVVLSFRFPVHKDKIEEPENNKIAAKIIGNFIGHTCEVRCIYEPEENHLVREIQKIGGQIVEVEEKWT
jgi:DNA polymerase-3 subunit gamma/tau